MVLPALLSAVVQSANEVMFRYMLAGKKMTWQKFVPLSFVYTFVFLLPFSFLFFNYNSNMLMPYYLLILAGMVFFAIFRSFFHFAGLKKTSLENAEPLALSSWIFTIILAFLFIPSEQNIVVLILALVAASAVISVTVKKHHFSLDKYGVFILVGAFLWSLHAIFLKFLLDVYDPLTLILVRTGLVSIILFSVFPFTKKDFSKNSVKWFSIMAFTDIAHWWLVLWSYQTIGVIMTSLILTLIPLLAEWFARIFLKEPLHWKNFLATTVICGCIGLSLFL